MSNPMTLHAKGIAERAAFARKMAVQAGVFCLTQRAALHADEIGTKGIADPVSRIDREAETLIRNAIAQAFPGEAIVGEEHGGAARSDFWVIDPLDGTANYLSGLPYWGVCIAWVEGREPVAGAIQLPELDLTLSGGVGAGVDGLPRIVSPGGARTVFGIGRTRKWPAHERQAIETEIEATDCHVVSYGASSVAQAHVLCGQLSGFLEHNTNLWDCAPGIAMARELGLHVRTTSRDDSHCMDLEIAWQTRSGSGKSAVSSASGGAEI